VHSLITNASPEGLNLQVLGFFDGTIDAYHLPPNEIYKIGQKVRCRVLYDIASTPPRFALSLSPHTLSLHALEIEEKYPLGTFLEQVKVKRVEPERGLVVEVAPSIDGYVHVRSVEFKLSNLFQQMTFDVFRFLMSLMHTYHHYPLPQVHGKSVAYIARALRVTSTLTVYSSSPSVRRSWSRSTS
jgi:hypothetical protein